MTGVAPGAEAASSAPAWGQAQKVPLTGGEPTSLSCPTDDVCAASDSESVSVLINGSWQSPTALPRSGWESAVSCASARSCVAVAGHSYLAFDGKVWSAVRPIDAVSTGAHAFKTLSCPRSDFCLAGAADGSSAVFDGRSWRAGPQIAVRADDFLSGFMRLSCTSSAFCMAMVQTEDGYGIYRLQGGAWRQTLGPSGDLHTGAGAFSCLSETFCMGGGTLEGKALRWNGDAWSETAVDTGSPVDAVLPNGLSCVSATLCVAVGTPFGDSTLGYAFQWDGTSWSARSAKSPKATPDLLSCSSARFCMALTENNIAMPVLPGSGGGGGGTEPVPVDQRPRFDTFPTKTVYPGDKFSVRATDPDGDPVTLGWSTLPRDPVKVTCSLKSANEASCSAAASTTGSYAPSQIMFTARSRQLAAQAPVRVSMRRFVGLGDSYSSGEGAADKEFEDGTHFSSPDFPGDVGCHRSPRTAWEVLLGRQLERTKAVSASVHVACSGARFTHLFNANTSWADLGELESPQLTAVNRDTVVATMTMGGNDVGFETILSDCTTRPLHDGVGCSRPGHAARDTADRGLSALRQGLVIPGTGRATMTAADVYENVAERMADGGTLVVGGYPHLFNTQSKRYKLKGNVCAVTDRGPLGTIYRKDAVWVNDTVDRGNTIIREAVTEAQTRVTRLGFKTQIVYADAVDNFGDKTVCSGHKKSLINYAMIRTEPKLGPIRQSFHPNKAGQAAYYKAFCDLVPVGAGVKPSRRCKVKEPK